MVVIVAGAVSVAVVVKIRVVLVVLLLLELLLVVLVVLVVEVVVDCRLEVPVMVVETTSDELTVCVVGAADVVVAVAVSSTPESTYPARQAQCGRPAECAGQGKQPFKGHVG